MAPRLDRAAEIFRRHVAHSPVAAVLVVRRLSGGAERTVEHHLGALDPLVLASVTKTLTAASALRLVASGRRMALAL